ncbi:hypothetical protein POM88_000068 [Heracleum sosnowskyi]|uniref:Uncharacterized protein n=1 Tax=Heracleum sosnowskyi TaxID=360622 RepID=A0AAD8JAR3_9APIA|nr:hypothetical protein POM88_000068 [Heracleum sosnowskyi]
MGFGVTITEKNGRNDVLPEGAALSQEDVLYDQDGLQIYKEEPLEQVKLMLDVLRTGMKILLDDAIISMDIHKQKPAVEEKQLKDVMEGAATILELNVNDIGESERGPSYQPLVFYEKNVFAMLKVESDEKTRDMLIMNDLDGEARNETQQGSTSQANEIFVRENRNL